MSHANPEALVSTEWLAKHPSDPDVRILATRFCEDYERIQTQFPSWQPDQMLARLWDQGGYNWLAAQKAD